MKKSYLFKYPVIFVTSIICFFCFSGLKESNTKSKNILTVPSLNINDFFMYMLSDQYRDGSSYWNLDNHVSSYDELNFNGAHFYGGNSAVLGSFDQQALTGTQISNMNGLISLTNGYGMQRFFDRNRISKLCFSQRLIYEISGTPNDITTHYGFCYRNKMTNTYTTDSGRTVLFAESGADNAGYLCDSIYENMHHTDLQHFAANDHIDWYAKPVVRIKQSDFSAANTTPVVGIVVKSFSGNTIDSVVIRINNFRNGSNTYNGEYKDNFTFDGPDDSLQINGKDTIIGLNYLAGYGNPDACKVDFKVYWYGLVDVWFDKMIVDDEIANVMLNVDTAISNLYNDKIKNESQHFGNDIIFSVDELVSSSAYTAKYVIDKAREYNPNSKIIFAISNNLNIYSHKNDTLGARMLLNIARPDIVAIDAHPFPLDNYYGVYIPQNLSYADSFDTRILPGWIKSNSVYNKMLQDTALGNKDRIGIPYQGTFLYQIYQVRNDIAQISGYNPKVVIQPQLQGWMKQIDSDFKTEGQREPTNEEIEAQTGMAVAHGADGISWFFYMSYKAGGINTYLLDNPPTPAADTFYNVYGMRNRLNDPIFGSYTKRTRNIYGQNKWDYVKNTNQKVMNWKPVLDKTKWDGAYSVHHEGANHEFISDIQSLYRDAQLDYEEFNIDASNERYWEMGFYENDPMSPNYSANDKSKYFIMVNRRCAPEVLGGDGDYRGLKVKFDAADLPNFNNWKVIDVNTGSAVVTINKNSNTYYNLGQFLPGEAKMYKIAPVMQEGGTFVAHEQFGNVNIVCKDVVNNGGYNLDIGQGSVINFEADAKIVMDGGEFTSGYSYIGSPSTAIVTYQGNSADWEGLEFNSCELIKINKADFKHLNNSSPATYFVTTTDCPKVILYNSLFTIESGHNYCGAINLNFVTEIPEEDEPSIDITGNTFDISGTGIPVVQIMGYSFNQTPVFIRWNNFSGDESDNAITLNNVTGGVISSNTFTEFQNAIHGITTYIDIYRNYIDNTNSTSFNYGLQLSAGSYGNLSSILGNYNAGFNNFYNYGVLSNNILTLNSYFLLRTGYNVFDVETGEVHLAGTFNQDYNLGRYENAIKNCFKFTGSDDVASSSIEWYHEIPPPTLDPVAFTFEPYECERPALDDYNVIAVSEYINDTLWYDFGGLGGGMSSKKSKSNLTEISGFENKSDSLRLFLRKGELAEVKRIGNEIADNHTDSTSAIDVIQPLYYSTMKTDETSHAGISALKTKLENLISNNSENSALVFRCNYFIQKCKVILGEYSSALSGFYDIMQTYPYDWEGVVAGWDYSATQLISQGGSGGGENNSQNAQQAELSLPNDDPKKVKTTIDKTLTNTKENAVKQIKIEEQQIKELRSDENNIKNIKQSRLLEKKIRQKKIMSEVIKPRKPQTVIEHINFVNADIQKIYSVNNKTTGIEDNTLIPQSYKLEQNYPNPFNPITKIKFEIPKESKVTIEIYDILGRKVAQLINNELKTAGRYEVQFNGHNFASGIYFYRLVASDFIQTKRMMLIK